MKKLLLNLSAGIVGIFFSFVLLEIVLRLLPNSVTKIDLRLPDDARQFLSTRSDAYKPNHSRTWTGNGPYTVWSFNNLGFRDRQVPDHKLPGTYRVMFIGDSMVMGLGVEDADTMPSQLQRVIREKIGNKAPIVEVFNFGIWGGTGPLDYLDILKTHLNSVKPDLVIVGFFTGNDLANAYNSSKQKTYFWFRALPDSLLGYKFSEYLQRKSYLYTLILGRYHSLVEKKLHLSINHNESTDEEAWTISEKSFLEMRDFSEKNNSQFFVLGLPSFKEIDLEKDLFTQRFTRMEKFSQNEDVNYFDLYPYLSQVRNYRNLFICVNNSCDTHFNEVGNAYVADTIAAYIFEKGFLKKD